ncbi:hypothetical protein P278_04710 [Zhouia amylolytica AD3]|uniref:Uncharacterized protein n=1 Tax=Zhouia amylolytica AD3 TaxID=1286632 RepID=W2US95_9FLAO|nr:hypothetical protein P278_04710 [Zhouia amylolytica AD3]
MLKSLLKVLMLELAKLFTGKVIADPAVIANIEDCLMNRLLFRKFLS